jgi:EAL domain-containing protein (putative c-di-GMP-specific phosphodiesterase class I)
VLPAAFLKPLEDSGKIDELTWTKLAKATAFGSAFDKAGLNTVVAINVSLQSLSGRGFADRIFEIVQQQNLSPDRICFEITEAAATSDLGATALENLTRLRMNGFGLSIDDLGTAVSSISQLTHIPFSELKIDRSFVANAINDESSGAVLRACLDIARQLKIKAVAEGVETLQEWTMLQELGCNIAQGHFIAEAMDAASYIAWVRSLAMEPIFHVANSPIQAKLH